MVYYSELKIIRNFVCYLFKHKIKKFKAMNRICISLIAFLLPAFSINAQDVKKEFFGNWTLEIEDGSVGWLNVNDSKGFIDAEMLWQGGGIFPVSDIYYLNDRTLVVTRASNMRRNDDLRRISTQTFTFEINGNNLTGKLTAPARNGVGLTEIKYKGWRLADPGPAPDLSKVKYGSPIQLFNGKDLTGWRLTNPNQTNGFKVVNGELVTDPVRVEGQRISYGNIRTDREFDDFKLTLEVNVPEGSNSGVYLRGMYEVQVEDSYGQELGNLHMGALYSRITPSVSAEKKPGEWQTLEITLCERHVTIVLNGVKIIDNKPIYGPTGGAIQADVNKSGPIYLQGDHGTVTYRNIVLTPIQKN